MAAISSGLGRSSGRSPGARCAAGGTELAAEAVGVDGVREIGRSPSGVHSELMVATLEAIEGERGAAWVSLVLFGFSSCVDL